MKVKVEYIIKFLIRVFGVLLIAWSIVIFSSNINYFFTKSVVKTHGLKEQVIFVFRDIGIFIPVLFLFCGLGLLKLKVWARWLLFVILSLILIDLIFYLSCFGFIGLKNILILLLYLGILTGAFIFINIKKVKDIFLLSEEQKKRERQLKIGLSVSLIVIICFSILIYIFFVTKMISRRFDFLYTPQKIVLNPAQRLINDNYIERRLGILSFNLPNDFKNISFRKSSPDKNEYALTFKNTDDSIFLLADVNSNFFDMLNPVYKLLGSGDSFEFCRQYIRTKLGIIFLILKSLSPEQGRYDEIESDSWRGFVSLVHETKKEKYIYSYSIFSKSDNIPFGFLFILNRDSDCLFTQNIIASLKFSDASLDNPDVLFGKGLMQLQSGKAEEAKYAFINCLLKDDANPDYHFYLAKAYLETKDINSARYHLEETLKVNPNYVGLKDLLNSIKGDTKK